MYVSVRIFFCCRVARTFCFSNNGHALYLCSPSEIQKVTISADEWFILIYFSYYLAFISFYVM